MQKTTQDLRKENDNSAAKGEKVEAPKRASLSDCLKQLHKTKKTEGAPVTQKPAAVKPVK